MRKSDVIILGAGLSGLTTAYILKDYRKEVLILEPRNRIGGRVHTLSNPSEAPVEMGATWVHRPHRYLLSLLEELGIETFDQVMGKEVIYEQNVLSPFQYVTIPTGEDPSLRVKGGTSKIITGLIQAISSNEIIFAEKANTIINGNEALHIKGDKNDYSADLVISTLPPNLLVNTINFDPFLPRSFIELAKNTHTWMGDSLKVGLTFEEPFWREGERKGTIFSNSGPITEMYDHSNFEDDKYSIKGFLDHSFVDLTKERRKQLVTNQLRKYYGDNMDKMISYHEYVWQNDPHNYHPNEEIVSPHQNNGHSQYQMGHLSNRLILSGTETSAIFPGYMEGAVYSGLKAAESVKSFYKNQNV
ncbi:MAG: NAD(P)/FAD-dependent oxidoreductase [Saprospiraceae bacterium]|nr:NAD(P)/FAD-dependent oxidoreductase [Saprospiraceae bacterium]